jgi:antitoxin MazE
VVDGKLVLEPVKPVYTLVELLAQVTPENLHQEVETGAAVGSEVW